MTPLRGFTPDAPSSAPGVLLDCSQFIPYAAGMRTAPAPLAYAAALAAECRGAAQLSKLDASRRTFAGTSTKLYELSGTSWTDRSRVGDYSLAASSRWSFTQFGDVSLAANIDNVIQSSTSGAFANQATAPQASIVESVLSSGGGFVFAFNTIDGTYGTSPDRWWCSAVNDHTSWTPSPSTQATTGRLLGVEGPIVAARRLGADRIVAYKQRAMYAGTFVGPPAVWAWQEIPGFGCVGLDAVADLGTMHFVAGEEGLFLFDGSRPVRVDEKVHAWFLANLSTVYRQRTIVRHDRTNELVWVFFPSPESAGQPDRALVYHLRSGEWGRADRQLEAALLFVKPAESFDGDSGTFDAALGPFDAVPETRIMTVFDTAHVLSPLEDDATSASFTLHDIGDDEQVSRLTDVALRYEQQPSGAHGSPASVTLQPYGAPATGGTLVPGPSVNSSDLPGSGANLFQLRQTARWHRIQFSVFGACRVSGYRVRLQPAGRR